MVDYDGYCTIQDNLSYDSKGNVTDGYFLFYPKTINQDEQTVVPLYTYTFGEKEWNYTTMAGWFNFTTNKTNNYIKVTLKDEYKATTTGVGLPIGGKLASVKLLVATSILREWKLTDIDDIREKILAGGSTEISFSQKGNSYLDYLTKSISPTAIAASFAKEVMSLYVTSFRWASAYSFPSCSISPPVVRPSFIESLTCS